MLPILCAYRICVLFPFLLLFSLANEANWLDIKSLKAAFKQEIRGERGAIPAIYQGKLYAKDNKVKWEYNAPLTKEVYIQGDSAYIYEPDLKQVTIGRLKENVDFIHIIKAMKKNNRGEYEATIADTKYTITAKDSKPYSLSYKDTLDNQILIIFYDVELNVPIDYKVFVFDPPSDVEYIDAY